MGAAGEQVSVWEGWMAGNSGRLPGSHSALVDAGRWCRSREGGIWRLGKELQPILGREDHVWGTAGRLKLRG